MIKSMMNERHASFYLHIQIIKPLVKNVIQLRLVSVFHEIVIDECDVRFVTHIAITKV